MRQDYVLGLRLGRGHILPSTKSRVTGTHHRGALPCKADVEARQTKENMREYLRPVILSGVEKLKRRKELMEIW